MPPAHRHVVKDLLWAIAERPLAAPLLAYARLVVGTSTFFRSGPGARVPGPAIYVSWHADLPVLVPHFGGRAARMMVSGAPYMRPIRRLSASLGLRLIVGTSGAGGMAALARLAEESAAGADVYLSVDGPAGPAFLAKAGCVRLAAQTGRPIVPVAVRSNRPVPLPGRWDRMRLHLPLNAFEVLYGAPLQVATSEDEALALARVQQALDDVFARAQGIPKTSRAFFDSTRSRAPSSSGSRATRRSSRSQA